ncbi:hypothetical protein B0H17DRAFT_1102149 [Mycena rosella]|uniref:Uncharacterized protein n=1 Tax=Mycena rosella TaxID=1033263 RepID=A0AAD7FZZ8_MYCRO|nr:hypothetical protein B0H17DRAFT_1102149 [Mycena rosella]
MIGDQCFVGDTNWGGCPNPDVAGILVRVSAYMANVLFGIVLMYSPKEASTAVGTQLLTVYFLLVSGIIAIGDGDLLRSHAAMTVFLVMSPLRREHLLTRLLVIDFVIISLALATFTALAKPRYFSPDPCIIDIDGYKTKEILMSLLFIPYAAIPYLLVPVMIFDCQQCGTGQRRFPAKQYKIQSNRSKFWVTWCVLTVPYPLLHFCGVFLVPMMPDSWVPPDNIFSMSFGQVLAIFVVFSPLLQVIQMTPMMWPWFRNLAFIGPVKGYLVEDYNLDKDSSVVDPFMDFSSEYDEGKKRLNLSYSAHANP